MGKAGAVLNYMGVISVSRMGLEQHAIFMSLNTELDAKRHLGLNLDNNRAKFRDMKM